LPVWIPGDAQKSLNAVKSSLGQFDSAKIPDCERERVWFTLYGALLAYGIKTDRRTFAANSDAPATEPPPLPEVKTKPLEKEPEIEAVIAEADRRATALLRSLGYE
jgi:hypothetical protein